MDINYNYNNVGLIDSQTVPGLAISAYCIVLRQRNRLTWFGHVQRKVDDDWVKL